MSVVVVGLDHRQAPLDLLERVAVSESEAPKVLRSLRDLANLHECVLLSTCLRTEVYAVVDRFHEAVTEIHEVLAERSGVSVETLASQGGLWLDDEIPTHLGVASELAASAGIRFANDVPAHLFSVAGGLESAVLGESEVLGQVRRAWERAREEQVCGPVLGELFRHAVQTGKRVRSETGIARGSLSFSHAAIELAERRSASSLAGAAVVVVGAGEVGSGMVRALATLEERRRPRSVVIANRSVARAQELAESVTDTTGALTTRAVPLGELAHETRQADVAVTALEADRHVLGAGDLALDDADAGRAGRPLLVVDLGMPRNVAPALGARAGVTLLDMDDLRASVATALEERHTEADEARAIVSEEVARHRESARARGASPVVAALRARLEEARVAELERRRTQFGELSEKDWAAVDGATRAVLGKLVHEPTVVLKETAGTPRGERLVEALRALFDL